MQWNEFTDSFPPRMFDEPVLVVVEGDIGIGKMVFHPATNKQDATYEWQILYPSIYKPGTAPSHWAKLPEKPEGIA